jgi:hypothetical protein
MINYDFHPQAQLAQIAAKAGTVPERLLTNVVTRFLDEEARFLAALEKGIAAAEPEHQELFATELPAFRPNHRADNLAARPLAMMVL